MEPGKFYGYFKPSYVSGHDQYMDLNISFLQAIEGVFRDELTPNNEVEIKELITADVANKNFQKIFKRTYNVQFSMNPDMA